MVSEIQVSKHQAKKNQIRKQKTAYFEKKLSQEIGILCLFLIWYSD